MTNYKRSFRLVCTVQEKPLVEELLKLQGFSWHEETFTPNACRLLEEPFSLGLSLAAFFGFIYIQDRASMLPPVALQVPKGALVLDMCASPGSKTGQLASMLGQEGFIIGNEVSPSRLATLRRNLQQMNFTQATSCCYEGQNLPLPDAFFDYIQLDPPCSGWGTIERNPQVMDMWKDEKTLPLIRLQKELLQEANRLLKPGGTMVFSTCTTNIEENEKQVLYAQEELGLLSMPLPPLPDFVLDDALLDCGEVWRLSPRLGDTQGFFVAKLQKPQNSTAPNVSDDVFENPIKTEPTLWGKELSSRIFQETAIDPKALPHGKICIFGDSIHFVHEKASLLPENFAWQGMYMGKVSKGSDIQLSPRLRLDSSLPTVDFEGIDGINAIKGLLQGQSLTTDLKGKNALMRWNGLNLGRLKIKNKRLLWTER